MLLFLFVFKIIHSKQYTPSRVPAFKSPPTTTQITPCFLSTNIGQISPLDSGEIMEQMKQKNGGFWNDNTQLSAVL